MLRGNGLGCWNSMPTWRRNACTSTAPLNTFSPPISTRPPTRAPGTRSLMRLTADSRLLLPQPLGPTTAISSPGATSRDAPSKAPCSP
ncbi:hypothetical protein D3C84_935970 [compost metagenome]